MPAEIQTTVKMPQISQDQATVPNSWDLSLENQHAFARSWNPLSFRVPTDLKFSSFNKSAGIKSSFFFLDISLVFGDMHLTKKSEIVPF